MNQNTDPEISEFEESVSKLIPKAQEGCKESQGELFTQLQDYCTLMAEQRLDRKLRAKINPSDVVQESLAKACNAIHEFRGSSQGEFQAWLGTIIQNQIHTARRQFHQQKRDVTREQTIAAQAESRAEFLQPQADTLTPSSKAIAEEELSNLRSKLDQLPENYRQVIEYRSLQRMSFDEVAERMGKTYEATTKLWYRAILKLRETIGDEQPLG